MKTLLLIAALAVAGCAGHSMEDFIASAQADCEAFGFTTDTEQFRQCTLLRTQQRVDAYNAYRARLAAAIAQGGNDVGNAYSNRYKQQQQQQCYTFPNGTGATVPGFQTICR